MARFLAQMLGCALTALLIGPMPATCLWPARPPAAAIVLAQIIESNPTPPIAQDPSPPIEQNPSPPIAQDPTPPIEQNPSPPTGD